MISEGINCLVDTGNGGLILCACEGAASQRERLRDEVSASDCWYGGGAT